MSETETDVQLVERLRRYVALCEATDAGKSRMAENQRDAADAIERLTAENALLRSKPSQCGYCAAVVPTGGERAHMETCEQRPERALVAQRDAQVREAFLAGVQYGKDYMEPPCGPPGIPKTREEAFAAFQARPSSGTGSGEKEQS